MSSQIRFFCGQPETNTLTPTPHFFTYADEPWKRCLKNNCLKFYRDLMGKQTPLVVIPSINDIKEAIKKTPTESIFNNRYQCVVLSDANRLFPPFGHVPSTQEGNYFAAIKELQSEFEARNQLPVQLLQQGPSMLWPGDDNILERLFPRRKPLLFCKNPEGSPPPKAYTIVYGEEGTHCVKAAALDFYRNFMKLKTPLHFPLPTNDEVKAAILQVPPESRFNHIFLNILESDTFQLFPQFERASHTQESMFFKSVHDVWYDWTLNEKKNKENNNNTTMPPMPPLPPPPPTADDDWDFSVPELVPLAQEFPRPPAARATARTVRRSNGSNARWNMGEIEVLLSRIRNSINSGRGFPIGATDWEQIASDCLDRKESWRRFGSSCKAKFERLAYTKKPTGTPQMKACIKQAKFLLSLMAKQECVGRAGLNDAEGDLMQTQDEDYIPPPAFSKSSVGADDIDDDDNAAMEERFGTGGGKAAVGASGVSTDGDVVNRPLSRKRRLNSLSTSIASLGTSVADAGEKLGSTMGDSLKMIAESIRSRQVSASTPSTVGAPSPSIGIGTDIPNSSSDSIASGAVSTNTNDYSRLEGEVEKVKDDMEVLKNLSSQILERLNKM